MKLTRLTPCKRIEIWSPRYKDNVVLIATYKVGEHNEITFSKAKHLPDKYYLSGKVIRSFPIESNGKIPCYAVPVDKLEPLERE